MCRSTVARRAQPGTPETRLSSQKPDATISSGDRTLQGDPASKAEKKFEQMAKISSAVVAKFRDCKSYENGNRGDALRSEFRKFGNPRGFGQLSYMAELAGRWFFRQRSTGKSFA